MHVVTIAICEFNTDQNFAGLLVFGESDNMSRIGLP